MEGTVDQGRVAVRSVTAGGRRIAVAEVLDTWLIEDEWWRTPVARRYVHLLLADGRILTLFHDLIGGGWFTQRYHAPLVLR